MYGSLTPSTPVSFWSADRVLRGGFGDFFGESVAFAGDFNDDGIGDFVIGAYADDSGGCDSGAASVFFGK